MKQYLSVLLVSILCGCKIVMHFHNHSKEAGLFKNTLRRCLYSNCYMVACSESVLKSIIRDYPDNPKCAVDNGVYFNRIAPLKAASRKDYGLSPDSIVCLIFGFDFYRKGVDLAIKAINRLRESEAYPFELLISLSSNFEFVENETRKILGDIPDWIHIIKARNDVYQLYNLADIFLSPSREEGLPYSVLEASYCKCSVIMSDISAQKYLKIPYGVWHKEENDEDLQEKILEAISMKKLKDNNLNSVRSEMEQHYGLDNWVNQMIAVYSSHGL